MEKTMATLHIHDLNDQLVQAYTSASKEQQQKVKQMIEEAITTGTQSATPWRRLLQRGTQKPFKPFKAITMKGEGPTASEMVIQDRI
jgi:hypothetical protein